MSNRTLLTRLGMALMLLAGAAWAWVTRLPTGQAEAAAAAPQAGFAAPDFTLSAPDGSSFSLSDARGQPVLLNFWASWCQPCRAEMPAIQELGEAYRGEGLIVLAVNTAFQDDLSRAAAFLGEVGFDLPVLLDADGAVSARYKISAMPTTFFIDRQGIIREVIVGGPMARSLLQIRIENLLQEAP